MDIHLVAASGWQYNLNTQQSAGVCKACGHCTQLPYATEYKFVIHAFDFVNASVGQVTA